MEQQPGHDPENDGPQPADAAPGPAAPGLPADSPSPSASRPGPSSVARSDGSDADAVASNSSASGSGVDPADASVDADAGPGTDGDGDGDGESVFGPWDALEGTLGAAKERAELLSGFAAGGAWDNHPPGPELAAALAKAAGPDFRCASATGEERIGLLRAMAALQSWAGAGMLGVIRGLIRDDDEPYLGRPKHGDLPDAWDDSLLAEIALALAVSLPSAEKTTRAAWELGARLPGVELLLRDGTLDVPRARLITEVFTELSDEDCTRAEELLLPELIAPPRKTYTQIERIATAIAAAVDPALAERRRKAAEKHRARVTMFREQSGAAALSGRDLPVDLTLAAYASLDARARLYKDSGAFPGERLDRLRATAYLDILNGVSPEDRIACGRLSPGDPDPHADADADADAMEDALDEDGPGPDEPGRSGVPVAGPGPGGSDCPCRECDGRCAPPDDSVPDDDFPDGDPGGGSPQGPGGGGPRGGNHTPPAGGSGQHARSGNGSPEAGGAGRRDNRAAGRRRGEGDPPDEGGPPDEGPDPDPASAAPRSPFGKPPVGPPPTPTNLILPLATLLGHAERPGEGHGLGTLDPALARALAATATRSPHTTVCVTVTNPDGIAIGHGCAKSGRPGIRGRPPGGPPTPLVALPARINLTITIARLAQLRAQLGTGPPGSPEPPGPEANGWALARRNSDPPAGSDPRARSTTPARRSQGTPGDPDWCGSWTLTLPTGLQYTVNLVPVPTYDCDHRNESHAYKPNDTLRHLVQIRDYTCTFPPCSRHARDSDFEHATPFDQGGRTCACNAGARSRKCHRVKQSPGWTVTQPRPGWHQWQTPRGRPYTQGPKHYPV